MKDELAGGQAHPAATIPGPIRRQHGLGSSGISRTSGLPTLCVGKASTIAVPVAPEVFESAESRSSEVRQRRAPHRAG
jgi:hypothetical protein